MGNQPGLVKTLDLTFSEAGDYLYVCLVHGWMMQGTVHVVSPGTAIPSPQKSKAIGQQEIAMELAKESALHLIFPPRP
jgi:heme/copper-type cytochrome/quinol oxidase subunit 2